MRGGNSLRFDDPIDIEALPYGHGIHYACATCRHTGLGPSVRTELVAVAEFVEESQALAWFDAEYVRVRATAQPGERHAIQVFKHYGPYPPPTVLQRGYEICAYWHKA